MTGRVRIRNSRWELLLLAGAALLAGVLVAASAPRLDRAARASRVAAADAAACRELTQTLEPLAQALAAADAKAAQRVLSGADERGAVPELLDRLAALGRACDVKVLGMTPQVSAARRLPPSPAILGPLEGGSDPGGDPEYSILSVSVEAEADFADVGRYFEELAGLDVPLAVTALEVEPAARGGADAVAVRFTLGTWVLARGGRSPT